MKNRIQPNNSPINQHNNRSKTEATVKGDDLLKKLHDCPHDFLSFSESDEMPSSSSVTFLQLAALAGCSAFTVAPAAAHRCSQRANSRALSLVACAGEPQSDGDDEIEDATLYKKRKGTYGARKDPKGERATDLMPHT